METYLIPWIGGKRLLRKKIAPLIPNDIKSYIEPFGGGGWILFYKEKWAVNEVYNDLNGDLVNLFQIVKYHPEAFKNELKYILNSRETFNYFLNANCDTDIKRAVKFSYLLRHSFGSKGAIFATRTRNRAPSSGEMFLKRVDLISKRLDQVMIENLNFKECIKLYDDYDSFFYLDPPYTKGAGYKTVSCAKFEHKALARILKSIKGRFLLSYNDCGEVRKNYKDFNIITAERVNGINRKKIKNNYYKELLITNYEV